jgi:hypothetical protein
MPFITSFACLRGLDQIAFLKFVIFNEVEKVKWIGLSKSFYCKKKIMQSEYCNSVVVKSILII